MLDWIYKFMTQEFKKDDQSTKNQLQDIALKLFVQNGYDKTSVNAIVKKAQVSKGAFYHYFDSKEEVLESVVDNYTQEVKKIISKIADEKNKTGLEKFNEAFARISAYKAQNINRLIKLQKLMNNEDSKLQEKLIEKLLVEINAPFLQIIKQGIKEGSFNTKYPEEIMGAMMYLGIYAKESIRRLPKTPGSLKVIMNKFSFIQEALTRILGAKKGDIKFASLKSIKYIYEKHGDDLME